MEVVRTLRSDCVINRVVDARQGEVRCKANLLKSVVVVVSSHSDLLTARKKKKHRSY